MENVDASVTRKRLAFALAIACGTAFARSPAGDFALRVPSLDAATTSPRYALHRALRAAHSPAHATRTPVQASGNVLVVTSCADDGGAGTLRSIIASAGEGDTVDLSELTCSTITLTDGAIDISVLGNHHINDLALVGPGADALTIDGNGGQIFLAGDFYSGLGTLAISDLRIAYGNYTGGLASCIDSTGNVALTRSTIWACYASGGAPLTFGGAVNAANLTMTSSSIRYSRSLAAGDATAIGGGAYVADDATLDDSSVIENDVASAVGINGTYITAGGGLYVRGNLTLTGSTIAANSADSNTGYSTGGGVFARGDVDIRDSTIYGNGAQLGGGAILKAEFSVYGDPGTTLSISNSTMAYNSSDGYGAAIATARPVTIANSTIAANDAAAGYAGVWCSGDCSIELESSVVAANWAGSKQTGPFRSDLGAQSALVVSGAHNLVNVVGRNVTVPADTLNADPLLLGLADYGGPTWTMALASGSPAIDAGSNPDDLDFDQRGAGFPRVSGAAADIGAFETPGDRIFWSTFDLTIPARVSVGRISR